MPKTRPSAEPLNGGCPPENPWPPERVDDAPPPPVPPVPPDRVIVTPRYDLRGPQIEPEAAFWSLCGVPCVIRIEDLVKRTDDPQSDCYFPPFPTTASVVRDELDELIELASRRDDPAVYSTQARRERRAISPFLQLRPQPIGAVVNVERDPVLGAIRAGRLPESGAIDVARGKETNAAYPVMSTGRELSRYFESETPGLAHRLALNELIRQQNWSPPRQALAWAALDATIYSALLAAWHYKWGAEIGTPGVAPRPGVSYRPRPIEMDHRVSVLYNRQANDIGSGDDGRRLLPDPSPGTPRHPAYPSGHSTYAGAASELLAYFFPDYTEEFDRLADNAGMARLWAGIHWRSDHVEGMKLGRCVARMIIEQLEASCICPVDPCAPPNNCGGPPSAGELEDCADHFLECCEDDVQHSGGGTPPAKKAAVPEGGGTATRRAKKAAGREVSSGVTSADVSNADVRAQAAGPQEGGAPTGSARSQRRQAASPQEGAAGAGSSERASEQAKGPQEGGR